MFKKLFLFCIVTIIFLYPVTIRAESLNLAPNAKASILMSASSNQILYASNEKEQGFPASTTKIMTMILLFEAIENHRLKWDDVLTCSAYAASMGGSQIYLEEGEQMKVSDLFKAISIASANDACVMVGERIAGTNDAFVSMMNEKATKLNLVNTHFMNATGLHDDQHYTCALDLAMMASYLLNIGGSVLLETTSLYDSYIREDRASKFWLVNTNKLLKSYDGCDGLKTGYTKEAGYCIVTTALRNGLRLIAIVLKESQPAIRNQEVAQLLDYGFSLYESIILYKKNEIIEEIEIDNAKVKTIKVIALEDIIYIKDRSKEESFTYTMNYTNMIPPIHKSESIGHLLLFKDNVNIGSYEIYSDQDIASLSLIEKIFQYLSSMI